MRAGFVCDTSISDALNWIRKTGRNRAHVILQWFQNPLDHFLDFNSKQNKEKSTYSNTLVRGGLGDRGGLLL